MLRRLAGDALRREVVRPEVRPKRPSVRFKMPQGKLFVGSYHRIPVRTGLIDFDGVRFVIPEGAKAGLISPSRDPSFNRRRPTIVLLVGHMPGTYIIEAQDATGNVIGKGKFTSDALWKHQEVGPTKWFSGISEGYTSGSAWGGGPAGPQNVGVVPATGTRRIAVLLVDTSSQRYTTDAPTLQGFRDNWMGALFNGVSVGGTDVSSRRFYQEASYNNFDLSGEVFGPVSLPGSFTEYFNSDGTPTGTFFQACFTAGDSLIDYNNFDTLLCVSQEVTGPPAMFAWPYASIGQWGPYTTAEGDRNYGVISMPNAWETLDGAGRRIYETFSHELGHNLGLGDQYTPGVPGRNLGGWDLMDNENPWPHFSIVHKMLLGWVSAGSIQTFNFQSMAAPVDQTVTLSPIETVPAVGRKAGVEIRIADGWNYYFEYRVGQAAQVGDRALPTDSRVLGTDVASPPYTPPILRPGILLLNNDIDGDGAVLANGTDYEETDTSDPVFPTDFRVDVNGIDGGKADVRVRYGVNSRPDPSIRPWPAGPGRQWQSPDIEIRNARNEADSSWANVPWGGNVNTIVARVRNAGGLDAPSVRVNFFVKNYNVGGALEAFLGTDVKDVAAGDTVEFLGTWPAPTSGHYCIIARIPLYQLPSNPAVVEMTELNNLAQSNYDRFISTTSVPSREVATLEVGNPYAERTRIWIQAGNTNPLYRTYLEHSWLYLDPGETRTVEVMYEFAPDHLVVDLYPEKLLSEYRKMVEVPNRVGWASFIENPKDHPRHSLDVLGGAQAEIVTGKSTEFDRFEADLQAVRGRVVTRENREEVPGGWVILRIARGKPLEERMEYQTVLLRRGAFEAKLEYEGERVRAYYIPPPGFGGAETEDVRIG